MKLFRYSQSILLAMLGFLGFVILWWLLTYFLVKELPQPPQVFSNLFELLKKPFYDAGPNDKGIGWQIYYSLSRVLTGFFIGSLIAIPLGFLIGMSGKLRAMFNPIIQILRPVSPLAWFPIGLAVFQASDKAAVFPLP
jgi:nitrate/nitrite transport system permease protein